MVDEQHQSDDAALRDGGALVDVVDAEGEYRRAQHDNGNAPRREPGQCTLDFLLQRLF